MSLGKDIKDPIIKDEKAIFDKEKVFTVENGKLKGYTVDVLKTNETTAFILIKSKLSLIFAIGFHPPKLHLSRAG